MKFFDKYVNGTYSDETGTQKWEISDNPIKSTRKSISFPIHDNFDIDAAVKKNFFIKGTPIKDAQPIRYIGNNSSIGDTYLTSGPSVVFYDSYDDIIGKFDRKQHKHMAYNINDYKSIFIDMPNSKLNDLIRKTLDILTKRANDIKIIANYYNNTNADSTSNTIDEKTARLLYAHIFDEIKDSILYAIRDIYNTRMSIIMKNIHTGPLVFDDTRINSIVNDIMSSIFMTVKTENKFNVFHICDAVSRYLSQTYNNILKDAVSYIMNEFIDSDSADDITTQEIKKSAPYTLRKTREQINNSIIKPTKVRKIYVAPHKNGYMSEPTEVYLLEDYAEIEPDDNYRMLVEQYNNNRARQQNITDGIKELGQ